MVHITFARLNRFFRQTCFSEAGAEPDLIGSLIIQLRNLDYGHLHLSDALLVDQFVPLKLEVRVTPNSTFVIWTSLLASLEDFTQIYCLLTTTIFV